MSDWAHRGGKIGALSRIGYRYDTSSYQEILADEPPKLETFPYCSFLNCTKGKTKAVYKSLLKNWQRRCPDCGHELIWMDKIKINDFFRLEMEEQILVKLKEERIKKERLDYETAKFKSAEKKRFERLQKKDLKFTSIDKPVHILEDWKNFRLQEMYDKMKDASVADTEIRAVLNLYAMSWGVENIRIKEREK